MRAARYHGNKDLRIDHIPDPACKPGWIKVAPAFCGICGTDIHEWDGGPTFAPQHGAPHSLTNETVPVGFGHEFSGTILEVGHGVVEPLAVGQRCAIRPIIQCFECRACKEGADGACDHIGFIGLSGGGGGLADAVLVKPHQLFPLPDNVPLDYGALVEPLAVGWHAAATAETKPGDNILILGGGPIGLAVLQAVKARDAGKVVVAEVAPARQNFARKFGADMIVNPIMEDTVARCRDFFDGQAADAVFDCAGVPASINTAVKAIRAKGTVINVAIWEKPVPIDLNALVFREARIAAILAYHTDDFNAVIEALKTGSLDPQGMITKRIKLDDLVEHGIKEILNNREEHIKIVVDMT